MFVTVVLTVWCLYFFLLTIFYKELYRITNCFFCLTPSSYPFLQTKTIINNHNMFTRFIGLASPLTSRSLPLLSKFHTTKYFRSEEPNEGMAPIGDTINVSLNAEDPTPTVLPFDQYPDWLQDLTTDGETQAALKKDYEKHRTMEEEQKGSGFMTYEPRMKRMFKLEHREGIKTQNETSNDL